MPDLKEGKAEDQGEKVNEFEDAFAEFSDKQEGVEPEEKEPEPELKREDEPKPEEPEPEVKKDEPVADIWEGASPALKASFDALESQQANLVHRLNSDKGRVGALQRKINALEKENEVPQKAKEAEDGKQWESLKEDYPEIAQAIESKLASQTAAINTTVQDTVNTAIQPLQQAEVTRSTMSELDKLSAPADQGGYGHEDWYDTRNSPEYNGWIAQQPVPVQEMMSSNNAADAAYLLTAFKAQLTQAQAAPESDGKVEKIQQQREQQLKDSASIIPKRESSQRGTPADDFDSAFSMYAKRKEKQLNTR